ENQTLFEFAQHIGVAPVTLVGKAGDLKPTTNQTALQREVRNTNTLLDIAQWRQRLFEVEQQVCRVEIKSSERMIYGTGFLVGPGAVLTNHHVMKPVIDKQVPAEKVSFRFDYKIMEDGDTINSGSVYRLAKKNWLIDESEHSPLDETADTNGAVPEATELDYALVQLDAEPGKLPVGANASPQAPKRKWITLSDKKYDFPVDAALYIVQHPQGEPLKMCLDTEAIIETNSNGTRVRYKTNTEPGSSGSPCFNRDWELVALHHAGDPNYEKLKKADYNQGVPTDMIYALLDQRKKLERLGR
ncbi:MAG TPA: serine protease, partial [Pyrinomonadaceae bacterium]|nr:serine protease [Pyrinomonadaceae bacterium]